MKASSYAEGARRAASAIEKGSRWGEGSSREDGMDVGWLIADVGLARRPSRLLPARCSDRRLAGIATLSVHSGCGYRLMARRGAHTDTRRRQSSRVRG
jgi:hypothetical protein